MERWCPTARLEICPETSRNNHAKQLHLVYSADLPRAKRLTKQPQISFSSAIGHVVNYPRSEPSRIHSQQKFKFLHA